MLVTCFCGSSTLICRSRVSVGSRSSQETLATDGVAI